MHMRLQLKQINWKQISLWNLYVLSLVITMIFLLTRKSELLVQTSLFDEASLEAIKERLTGGNALFLFVLKERAAMILALFLMATTWLGSMFVYMNVLWHGACSGLFLTIVLLRYGVKGVLLLMAGVFPHYLIYVPAMILTLQLTREKRVVNSKYCLQLIVILLVVITGCVLECYVNPQVVAKILKKF